MSLDVLFDTVAELPWGLREQVMGYAQSVEESLPEIFISAHRQFSRDVANKIVFIAGVRKLYSIVSSSFWTLDNVGLMLKKHNVNEISAGATDLSRHGDFYLDLKTLLNNLDRMLEQNQAEQFLHMDYDILVIVLSDDEH